MSLDSYIKRIDNNRVKILDPCNMDICLFANRDVPFDFASIKELLRLLEVNDTIKQLDPQKEHEIVKIALTPDFHKGKGIPVGTVIQTKGLILPQVIGNDINCGMRLNKTSLTIDQIESKIDSLETTFRHIFFEGGRNIPMTKNHREALFRNGIAGLLDSADGLREGLWALFHQLNIEKEIDNISQRGSLKAENTYGLGEFLGTNHLTRDGQIGSVGGGNHFVEIQYVKRILNGTTAHLWGIKKDMIMVMVHTGSLAIGHMVGNYFNEVAKGCYPSNLKYPANRVFPIICNNENRNSLDRIRDSLHNAGNFAFANRMFLSIMALDGLQKELGDLDFSLLYDSPHNFVWEEQVGNELCFIHRKGACSAKGVNGMIDTPFEYSGEPVIVPGSMGASSYLMSGLGNDESIYSASHGAGRVLSRGKTLKVDEKEFQRFLEDYRVITPVDFRRQDVKLRQDIVKQKLSEIKQEAPFAYKGITPVVGTLVDSGIADPVAELEPIMTIKG